MVIVLRDGQIGWNREWLKGSSQSSVLASHRDGQVKPGTLIGCFTESDVDVGTGVHALRLPGTTAGTKRVQGGKSGAGYPGRDEKRR